MPKIEASNKLSPEQEEYGICSKPYIFYRIIRDPKGVRLMTATASESTGPYRAFEDQKSLNDATIQVFGDFGMEFVTKEDHARRPYVETSVSLDKDYLLHIATTALERIGFKDTSVLALQDMKAIYEEFAVDGDCGEAYLSDGMWMTSDGRLIEK